MQNDETVENFSNEMLPSSQPTQEEVETSVKSDVILAFEAEYDMTIDSEIVWGDSMTSFLYDDNLYYYKPQLELVKFFGVEDESSEEYFTVRKKIKDFFGDDATVDKFLGLNSFDNISHIKKLLSYEVGDYNRNNKVTDIDLWNKACSMQTSEKNADLSVKWYNSKGGKWKTGIPQLLSETPHFYHFENVKGDRITPKNLTKDILIKIKETFDTSLNPFLDDLSDCLIFSNSKIFCTDLFAFSFENNFFNYGIMLNSSDNSSSFSTDYNYFFPFEKLNDEMEEKIKNLVSTLILLEKNEFIKETIIVNL
jgi:hypothetical protein